MKLATKTKLVNGILVALVLWPAIHRYLVVAFEVNPWKLGGLAMYCTPHAVDVQLLDLTSINARPITPDSLHPIVRAKVEEFRGLREILGRFYSPATVARYVMTADPKIEVIEIRIGIRELDPKTSKVARRVRPYRYQRL